MKTNNSYTIHFDKNSIHVSQQDYDKFNRKKDTKGYSKFCEEMLTKYVITQSTTFGSYVASGN